MSDASYTQVTGKLDLINRQNAIDDLHGKDPSRIWDTADIEVWLNDLPSAEPEIIRMNDKERKSCISTIELLRRLAFNVHGVMDVIDAQNCDKIIEMLNKPEPHWIPCSERLPEDKQKCLVTVKEPWGSCIDLARFAADLHSVDEYDFHDREESGWYYFEPDLGYTELTDVVAWMPLLEPYQPEEE